VSALPSIGRAAEVEPVAPALGVDAARVLYERHYDRLLGFCLNRLASREEAEDAVQTTFLNAFRGLQRGVVPQFESAWLFKIAENVCRAHYRSERRRGRVETTRDLTALDEVLPAPLRADDELVGLAEALTQIPASQRRAILLREWRGLSYREIAQELGLSNAAVETLIFRARRSLAQKLEKPRNVARRVSSLNTGSLLASLKSALAGGAALKLAAAAVALTGAALATQPPLRHELERIAGFRKPPARIGVDRVPSSLSGGLPVALVFPRQHASAGFGSGPFGSPLPFSEETGGEATLPGGGSETSSGAGSGHGPGSPAAGPLGQTAAATGIPSSSAVLKPASVSTPSPPGSVSVPTAPSVPSVPSAPSLPSAPPLPEAPSVPVTPPSADVPLPAAPATPKVPDVPSAPSVPETPAVTTPALPDLP
jgi:RNA polymerase sigma factor (sigma-70 family)